MPPLPNPRHERFAQERARGKTVHKAYLAANQLGGLTMGARLLGFNV